MLGTGRDHRVFCEDLLKVWSRFPVSLAVIRAFKIDVRVDAAMMDEWNR